MQIHQLVKCTKCLGFSILYFLILVLIFPITSSHSVDLTAGIRNIRRHQKWMSMELRHPMTGLFLAARASTEDKNQDATLNLTLVPEGSQCRETIEVLLKIEAPAQEGGHRDGLMEFVLDNREPQLLPTKIELAKGDRFVFMQVAGKFRASSFARHRTMLANARGWGLAEFSLLGFSDAWKEAQAKCSAFLPR